MPKPDDALVVKWRELAEEGFLYAEIARMSPEFSVDQVRHYCLGHTGRDIGGPIQGPRGRTKAPDAVKKNVVPGGVPDPGILYALSNPYQPGLLKIGKTTRTAAERAAELSSATGVPGRFKIEWESKPLARVSEAEQVVHRSLVEVPCRWRTLQGVS